MKRKVTANQQECAAYSASIPGSRFWTWNKLTKKCFPKNSIAGKTKDYNTVSGNNRCGNSGKKIPSEMEVALHKEHLGTSGNLVES